MNMTSVFRGALAVLSILIFVGCEVAVDPASTRPWHSVSMTITNLDVSYDIRATSSWGWGSNTHIVRFNQKEIEGTIQFELPEGTLHLAVEAVGYHPFFHWDFGWRSPATFSLSLKHAIEQGHFSTFSVARYTRPTGIVRDVVLPETVTGDVFAACYEYGIATYLRSGIVTLNTEPRDVHLSFFGGYNPFTGGSITCTFTLEEVRDQYRYGRDIPLRSTR